MSMIDAIPLLAGAGADGGYQISRSVRTRSSVSAYFNRTFSTPTLGTKWTWSGWVKRGTLGAAQTLFSGQVDINNWGIIAFLSGDTLSFQQADAGSVTSTVTTTQVFRDPSAWYHIVVAFDSTQATAANRLIMYVNGVQITAFGTATYLAQNTASRINAAVAHQLSRYISAAQYFDGYMTEVNFVDGQALTPSSFGETNALTGVWQPKRYTGTYGTNGFYLNFSDNSATDALGYDFSTGLYSKNLRTSGTNIGTFTANGGLTAAFDGNFNQPNASSARVSIPAAGYNTAVIGKDWGAGVTKTITAVQLFSQNDGGFVGGTTTALVFKLQGSNDNSTWTDLTSPITGPATGANTIITVTSGITTSTAYRYHRINVNADGVNNYYMCELAFYEAGSYNLNNWFPNNISLTAGATYDSMLDVPTLYADGGNGRGNYCTLNPLYKGTNVTPTQGNLKFGMVSGNFHEGVTGTIFPTSGKWYAEFLWNAVTANTTATAVCRNNAPMVTGPCAFQNSVDTNSPTFRSYIVNGNKDTNTTTAAYGSTYTANDTIGVALDLDNGKVWFAKNGTWQASGDPAAGTNAAFTDITGSDGWTFGVSGYGSGVDNCNANFGQQPFTYTPPTGFKALNTQNLPTPTILKGNQYFDATTYTGNASTNTIVNAGGFQPDLVWLKSRSAANNHTLFDSVRGANNILYPNLTNAAAAVSQYLNSFNSNGFTLGANENSNDSVGESSVGWQWNAGGTSTNITVGQYGTSPNVPSIASTVRANPTAGFSVVTYTGTGANATVGHGLGVAPKMIIARRRDNVVNWYCYHSSLAAGNILLLNTTQAQTSVPTAFNSGTPTSTTFPLGADTTTNASGGLQLAYCFAEVAGFSKIGSYTGNGSADGPFVFCGFRPRYVMLKSTTAARDWLVYDTARGTYNVLSEGPLQPNTAGTPYGAGYLGFDILSNGFKLRESTNNMNANGETHIFMAFAENPFKLSLAR